MGLQGQAWQALHSQHCVQSWGWNLQGLFEQKAQQWPTTHFSTLQIPSPNILLCLWKMDSSFIASIAHIQPIFPHPNRCRTVLSKAMQTYHNLVSTRHWECYQHCLLFYIQIACYEKGHMYWLIWSKGFVSTYFCKGWLERQGMTQPTGSLWKPANCSTASSLLRSHLPLCAHTHEPLRGHRVFT